VYHSLMSEFERRSLGGVRFLSGISPAELERFFQLFMAAEDPVVAERLADAVVEASIQHIVPLPAVSLDEDDLTRSIDDQQDPASERGRAKRVFWRAVLGTKKILLRAKQTGRPDLRHAKRLVQPLVDSVMRHEYSIVGLTALKDHDEYTYAHCVNVSILSVSMGQALGLPRQALADLGVAGLMHDVGKIAVPDAILQKPSSLDPTEWDVMRRHPETGAAILDNSTSQVLKAGCMIALHHHEKWDGSGYPAGLSGERIPLWGRICAVADVFDAVTSERPYKRAFTNDEATRILQNGRGTHFDPNLIDVFFARFDEIVTAQARLRDGVSLPQPQ
jgi:HD-GYP domain-containing protein (c-di-GMP phosphodiesterase class II)